MMIPRKVRYMWLAVRPRTLAAGGAPVLLGNALGVRGLQAAGGAEIMIFLASLVGVVALQAGANLVNDVADASRGVDSAMRQGPLRVTQSGLLTASQVRWGYRAAFALAILAAMFLAFYGGVVIIALTMIGALFAYLYTGGPVPLSHLAMGELLAFVFFGPLAVAGCAYLHTHVWGATEILLGCGPGLWAASLMAINNYRDRATDRLANKRTLALLLPELAALEFPIVCQMAALVILFIYGVAVHHIFVAILTSLALSFYTVNHIRPLLKGSAAAQNAALSATMFGSFAYAVVLCILILF